MVKQCGQLGASDWAQHPSWGSLAGLLRRIAEVQDHDLTSHDLVRGL